MEGLRPHHRSRRRGQIIPALALATVSVLAITATGSLVMSHMTRVYTEAEYSRAIHVAEAGVNYELEWIAQNLGDPSAVHQAFPAEGDQGPLVLDLPDGRGRVEVGVTDETGTGRWHMGEPMRIIARGTSGGVSRAIEIASVPESRLGALGSSEMFAVFGTKNVKLTGSKAGTVGHLGTNGTLQISGGDPANVKGDIVFCGSPPTISAPNVFYENASRTWPTVPELLPAQFPGGWAQARLANDNNRIATFDPEKAAIGIYSHHFTKPIGIAKSDWHLNHQLLNSKTITLNQFGPDRPRGQGGWRHSNEEDGLRHKYTIIFPPGDYYFESIDITSTANYGLLIDNETGPVTIWVGDANTSNDKLHTTVILTDPARPDRFRIYYGKRSELSVNGTSLFAGFIYALDAQELARVKVSGYSLLLGAVVGHDIEIFGNSAVEYPRDYPFQPLRAEPLRGYRFSGQWREVNGTAAGVFADGTRY